MKIYEALREVVEDNNKVMKTMVGDQWCKLYYDNKDEYKVVMDYEWCGVELPTINEVTASWEFYEE